MAWWHYHMYNKEKIIYFMTDVCFLYFGTFKGVIFLWFDLWGVMEPHQDASIAAFSSDALFCLMSFIFLLEYPIDPICRSGQKGLLVNQAQ